MARGLRIQDISNEPELLRIVEEVRRADEPRLLRRNNEDLAILMPAKPTSKRKPKGIKRKEDFDAFRSAFGGWRGIVDADAVKKDLASGRGSDRPPVRL